MSITGTETSLKTKTRIAVVGIGGVGGYYGGLLSKYAEAHPEIRVVFVSRGANLQKIREEGLKVIVGKESFVTRPALATDDCSLAGKMDYILLATKSYDLEATAAQIAPMVGEHTIILPLLNGIDNTAKLRAIFPGNEVWYGCVYIVARLNEPGVVESSGNVHYFHFGHEKKQTTELNFFENLLKEAGFDVALKEDPVKAIWRKFFFISVNAALTTYLNTGFSNLVHDADKQPLYVAMMRELLAIAHAEGVMLHETIIDDMLKYGGSLPAGTTSSMNSDYLAGRSIELATLVGVVVKLAQKHAISTPVYDRVYKKLAG
jgi:2-dehydropantoate 2-reductase